MLYDVIIIGAGAAGLFAGINLPKNYKKLILEKNKKPGIKVLLSGGERANISNIDINPERDYFSQNKKFLLGVFAKYNNWDLQNFFIQNGIKIIEEDRGRLILKSGDSKELLNLLLTKVRENKCKIKLNSNVIKIEKINNYFRVETINQQKFLSKNIIVSTGGKSFFQVGTTGEGYNFAKNFGLKIISSTKALVGLVTKENLKNLAGISLNLNLELFDIKNKIIYKEFGPFLFTHFGVSGPIIFNTSNAIGEYLNKIGIKEEKFEKYILDNFKIRLIFSDKIPKRVEKFFNLTSLDKKEIILNLQNWRSWKEAKATYGGLDLNELNKNFMVNKIHGLYFIGEVLDIVGKTGGFNLQLAFSSGYICGKSF